MSDELPDSVSQILAYLAEMARSYDNHLKWNEVDKLKSDLMKARARWIGVPVSAIGAECRSLGMRDEDTTTIVGLVGKAQAGRKLVPGKTYRDFRFNLPVEYLNSDPPAAP